MESSDQGTGSNARYMVFCNDLVKAYFYDNLEEVMASLDNAETTPEKLQTCLTAACTWNSPQVADYLLNKGAEIDYRAAFGACSRVGSVALFEVLIKHGWDINGPVGYNHPPIM
jgi:hypothetical protein